MSKNRSHSSLKKLLRAGYWLSIREVQVGTYRVVARDGLSLAPTESLEVQGSSIGDACAQLLKKLEVPNAK